MAITRFTFRPALHGALHQPAGLSRHFQKGITAMSTKDEMLAKKTELTAKVADFQGKAISRSSPEDRVRAQIKAKENELRKANRDFAALYISGTPEALKAARMKVEAAEESIRDLTRVLEAGVLRDEEAQKLFVLGTEIHEEAFRLGQEMQANHPGELQKVLEARATYIESVRQLGEFTRSICAVAVMLDETRRWTDRYHAPMTIRPNSLENFILKLIVDDVEIRQAQGVEGQWLIQR
jgi:hypothetical protein